MQSEKLIDTAGVAELLGVQRAHATNVLTKDAKFPKPVINLSQRLRRWRLEDVVSYASRPR